MKQLQKYMQPFIVTANTAEKSLELYEYYINEMGVPSHILQSSPGIKWTHPTPEEIRNIVQSVPQHASLCDYIQQFIDLFYHCQYTAYFSEQGLDIFCQEGKLPGQIGIYFPPLSLTQRIVCLNHLLQTCSQEDCSLRMVSRSFDTPINVYTEIYGIRGILFAHLNPDKVHLKFCYINESNLCRSFFDFFQNAEEIGIVLPREQTVDAIKKRLTSLQTQQTDL